MPNTVTPKERAIQIFTPFWKEPQNNFFDARRETIYLINTLLDEAKYANHLETITYFEKVLKEAENL